MSYFKHSVDFFFNNAWVIYLYLYYRLQMSLPQNYKSEAKLFALELSLLLYFCCTESCINLVFIHDNLSICSSFECSI